MRKGGACAFSGAQRCLYIQKGASMRKGEPVACQVHRDASMSTRVPVRPIGAPACTRAGLSYEFHRAPVRPIGAPPCERGAPGRPESRLCNISQGWGAVSGKYILNKQKVGEGGAFGARKNWCGHSALSV